jgi:hypothetical protein
VIEYDRAQFRLYWALGQPPETALPKAAAVPAQVPVLPPAGATSEKPPAPRPGEEPRK